MTERKAIDLASARPLLESLSASRMSLLHLARVAREGKNLPLARDLAEKAGALKTDIARLRRQSHGQWAAEARQVRVRLNILAARLEKISRRAGRPGDLSRKGVGILKAANAAARVMSGLGR